MILLMKILPKQRIPRITILNENFAAAVHPEKSGQDLQRSRTQEKLNKSLLFIQPDQLRFLRFLHAICQTVIPIG